MLWKPLRMELKMKVRHNLTKLLNQVTDTDMVNGMDWYKKARVFCYQLSLRENISYVKVCGILAALSPRNRWERNKIDAENLIKHLRGTLETRPLFGTYNAMVRKAIEIYEYGYDTGTITHILNGPKITCFFENIYDANNMSVTVDTWMVLAAAGKYLSIDERPSVNKALVTKISDTIQELAERHQMRPYELQAILWCAIKRLNGPAAKDQK